MTLNVEVISRETIKPSSPTPHHLKNFKLSHLDQYTPPIGVPIILFYSANHFEKTKMSDRLKKTLSKTLTDFYPLGGKIKDNNSIDCDDSGVEYLETQVKAQLYQFLNCPEADELNQLIPLNLNCTGMSSEIQLAIQVNVFECGGIAIAACISHKVADASSLCTFLSNWAANARGANHVVFPQFDSAPLFPPREVSSLQLSTEGPTHNVVTKRFIFDSSNIAALKAKSANYVENPTRVEAVATFLWRCFMNVASLKPGSIKSFMVNIAVNLRSRMVPPLPDHSFGNLIMAAMPSSTADSKAELHCLVGQLREAIRRYDGDYMKNLQDGDGVSMFYDSMRQAIELFAKGEMGFYTITSWCRFPFYEIDFGWGKPIWASSLNMVHKNVVILMDTKYGDGIEALVTLDEEDMARFECEEELLAFTSPKNIAYVQELHDFTNPIKMAYEQEVLASTSPNGMAYEKRSLISLG